MGFESWLRRADRRLEYRRATAYHRPVTNTTESPGPVEAPSRTEADAFVCTLLRVPEGPKVSLFAAENAMRRSIILSGIRCTLTYIVIPFIVPFIGLAAAIDAPLGILVGLAAMLSLVTTVRRFFMAHHPKRWWYTWFAVVMFAFLVVLMVRDVIRLAG